VFLLPLARNIFKVQNQARNIYFLFDFIMGGLLSLGQPNASVSLLRNPSYNGERAG
jgi:hypothetical protein